MEKFEIRFDIRITKTTMKKVREIMERKHLTKSEIGREALNDYLFKEGEKYDRRRNSKI